MHCELLDRIKEQARKLHTPLNLRRYRTRVLSGATRTELTHITMACTFLAFVQLGGDVDAPHAFDWSSSALWTRANRLLNREITLAVPRTRRQQVRLDAENHVQPPDVPMFTEPDIDPSSLMHMLEHELPDRDWTLLHQVYVQNQSPETLRATYGCSAAALWKRISRARHRARHILSRHHITREEAFSTPW